MFVLTVSLYNTQCLIFQVLRVMHSLQGQYWFLCSLPDLIPYNNLQTRAKPGAAIQTFFVKKCLWRRHAHMRVFIISGEGRKLKYTSETSF